MEETILKGVYHTMDQIGYARISTTDQILDVHKDALAKAGCERVYEDTASGAVMERPGLAKALDYLREGDTLVVCRLDRLGRTVKGLMSLADDLKKKGVHLASLNERID